MVRQWQDMTYQGNRAGYTLSGPMEVKYSDDPDIYPDFVKITDGYRVKAKHVQEITELEAAYERMLEYPNEPFLLDLIVDFEKNVYPMIPASGTYKDIIMEKPTG
jgi:acetolactate synthase I/II/III large subunit